MIFFVRLKLRQSIPSIEIICRVVLPQRLTEERNNNNNNQKNSKKVFSLESEKDLN